MNDNELKTALCRMTDGVSTERIQQKVRERILEEASAERVSGRSDAHAGKPVRRRWPIALAAAQSIKADAIPLDELKRRLRASGAIVPEGN